MSALSLLDAALTAAPVAAPSPPVPPLWRWMSKWGYFLGLAGLVGSLAVHLMAVRPALGAHSSADVAGRGERAAQRVVGLAAVVFAVAYVFQLASATARGLKLDYADAFAPATVWSYLTMPARGDAWVGAGTTTFAQAALVLAVLALLVPLASRRARPRHSRLLATALALSVLVTVVRSSPTAPDDLEAHELVGSFLVQVHIVAGSVWVGGLAVLAVLALSRLHIRDADVDTWSSIWTRFSIMAMAGVGAIAVSGAWLTWKEVGSIDQLVTTPFGRLLVTKIVLVLALVGFGAFNQLVVMPRLVRLRRAGQTASAARLAIQHLGWIVLCESVIGAAVLLVVGLLSGSARAQAGGPPAVVDWTVYGWGAAFAVGLVAAFLVAGRVATFLAARPLARTPDSVTP